MSSIADAAEAAGTVASAAPRDGASSRAYIIYVVALLTLTNALSYADRQLFAILVPSIKTAFGASDATIGLLGGPAFMVAYVTLCLPLAWLADRYSRRKVLALSVALWSAATAWCGMAASIGQLAAGRIGVGIGEAGGSPPAQSLISSTVSARYRSTALGIFTMGTYIGVAAGMWGGAALDGAVGWRNTFLLLAIPGGVVALLVWCTMPRRTAPLHAGAAVPFLSVLRHCWSIPSFRLIAIGAGTMNIFAYATSVWMPSYLIRSHGLTLVEAGFWNGVTAAGGGLFGALLAGLIVDRLTRSDQRYQMIVPAAGFLLAAPVFAAQLLWPQDWTATIGGATIPLVALLTVPAALLMALWMPPAFGAVQNLVPAQMRAQAAAALIVMLFLMGGVFGPILTGVLSDVLTPRFGEEGLRYSLLVSTVALLAGAAIFLRAARHYPMDLKRAQGVL